MPRHLLPTAAALAAFALSAAAHAGVLTMNLDTGINGTTPYATDRTPWLSATFTDLGVSNGLGVVQLVMTSNLVNGATGLPTGEFVGDWLFNVDPAVKDLTYTAVSGYNAAVTIGQVIGSNAIKGGTFDIDFAGGTANANRFGGGMQSVYTFAATGLSANSFAFTSNKGYYSAADVKGIGNGLSGSIGATSASTGSVKAAAANVPEPTSLMLFGLGAAALVFGARRTGRTLRTLRTPR